MKIINFLEPRREVRRFAGVEERSANVLVNQNRLGIESAIYLEV